MMWVLVIAMLVGPYNGGRDYVGILKIPGMHTEQECLTLAAAMSARASLLDARCKMEKNPDGL